METEESFTVLTSMLTYLQTHAPELVRQTLTHLGVSLLALSVAALIGIPCGYLASRSPRTERWVTGPFQVLRVIPSLAVLVLLIPLVGTGCGCRPRWTMWPGIR